MFCSISNRVPTDPVVAKTSGCLFERSLIERYIEENGRCPVTGEPLAKDDLIAVRPSATSPSAAAASSGLAAASVPGLLERMRAEWDGVMLEQFSLRQQLAQQQQELAHALQQTEAACRVIAKMAKERESLRHQRGANGAAPENMDDGDDEELPATPMPADVGASIDKAEADQQAQRKERKGKEMPIDKLTADPQSFTVPAGGEGTHNAGATALAVLGGNAKGKATILTAGLTNYDLTQFSLEDRKTFASGTGHTKPIHTITVTQNAARVVTAAGDSTVRVWEPAHANASATTRSLLCEHTLRYASGVSALSRRTIDDTYIFSGSRAGTVYLSDITKGEHVVISEVRDDEEEEEAQQRGAKRRRTAAHDRPHAITAVELHPYTKLGAIATEGSELFIWNVKDEAVDTAIALPKAKGGKTGGAHVCSLDFSLDCVTLAAGLSNGHALVWDLRRIEEPVADIAPASGSGAKAPAAVAFDLVSGTVLAVGSGAEVRVGRPQELSEAKGGLSLAMDGKAAVRGLAWGPSYLAATGIDGVVKVFGEY